MHLCQKCCISKFFVFHSGYGNQTPKTGRGRAFCVFFALFGIPLCLTWLAFFGRRIQALNKWLSLKLHKAENSEDTSRSVKVSSLLIVTITGTCLMILAPAIVFSFLENWDYGTSLYYCVITLSTIGFGDYVAGTHITS